ncbi:MAG: hypothetical protein AAFX56_14045 [Pseudomonadota bacterium]
MTKKSVFMAGVSMLITACAAGKSLSDSMAAFEGSQAAGAIALWGEPDLQTHFEEQTLLVWHDYAADSGWRNTGTSARPICERTLAVDAGGTVTGWRWRGDACPLLSPAERQRAEAPQHAALQ